MRVACKKVAKKGDGLDLLVPPIRSTRMVTTRWTLGNQTPRGGEPHDDAHMVPDDDEDDDDSVVQVVTKKVAKKGHAFASGFGTHDQRDAGEPTAHEKENPNDGVDMASDSDDVDDDSLEQDASKKFVEKDNGFDGFGTPDPFNQNSDDQADAEETYAPNQENSNDDANMVSDEDENDYVSLVQPLSQTNST